MRGGSVVLALALWLLATSAGLAQSAQQRIEAALAAPALRQGIVGVQVRSLATGKVLFERNPDTALLPASNLKLLTASAALALLGPEFRFRTRVVRLGDDLYLIGGGDPSLDAKRLTALAEQVRASWGSTPPRRVLADASYFDSEVLGNGWQWDDEPFYYSAQVSGLGCDENVAPVTISPGAQVGSEAIVSADPYFTEVMATVQTVPGKEVKVTVERLRGRNAVLVRGTIGRESAPVTESLTVEDPARFTAQRFAAALGGLSVGDGVAPKEAIWVAESRSAPLATLLGRFLKPSDNLYGECLLKAIGAERVKVGSAAAGSQAVLAWLAGRGLPTAGVAIADGSGLSRMNLVTARLLAALLSDQAQQSVFRTALPVGGGEGTLRSRFKNTPLEGKVEAKTGTLTGASSLSGYLTTRAGEPLVFAILMNNYQRAGGAASARAAQDALVLALYDWPRHRK